MNAPFNMTTVAASNSAAFDEALAKRLYKLGKQSIAGDTARPDFGLAILQEAVAGRKGEDDAAALYQLYLNGRLDAMGGKVTAAGNDGDAGAVKQQVSKARQILKMGALPAIDPEMVMDRAMNERKEVAATGAKVKAAYDAMVDVARAQIKQPDEELTAEQLRAIVSKPEPRSKDDLEKLVDAYKAAAKMHEVFASSHTETAVNALADAIVEAGGEVPPTSKQDKEVAAFLAKAAKLGLKLA